MSEFRCNINAKDPPDLIITWKHGERWGVEITRTYQQVRKIGKAENISSKEVSEPMRAFGDELGKETENERRYDYTLYLEGPGSFSSWKPSDFGQPWKSWKKETRELIRVHIASGKSSKLQFTGGQLRPGETGKRWTVMVGSPVAELKSATAAMLRHALEDKMNDLNRWNRSFAQRWLLLLNCYPLADDSAEVEGTLRQLVRENAELTGFDGVFWSGYPDRTLIPIPLSQNL